MRGILFSDMVGSTELRGRLGEDRADALRRVHDDILGRCVAAHDGTVLRWTGDGLKADFASASGAVSAAIDMQRAVARYGRTADAVATFRIRIGIGVGEVTTEDGDIHGVAVIEAARLEALAAPGEILATDLVHRLGMRRVDADFEHLGARTLKGLDDPVDVVRIVGRGDDAARPPIPRAVVLDRRFPLVGRDDHVQAVIDRWGRAMSGSAGIVLVTGLPGMGKSRFIGHVADAVHADGALVLAGVCDSDLVVPYQPFAMALSEVGPMDEQLAAAIEVGAGPLGPLFPSRRGRTDDPGPSARFDLFEAVVELLQRLSHDQPLVLVLEDLHWATSPTVQLLRHLIRQPDRSRVLVLASYRAEEVGPDHPLGDLIAEVRAGGAASMVELGPLDEADIVRLIAARAPGAPPEHVLAFARRIRDESGGSPFFVCELLHHLAAGGQLERLVGQGTTDQLPIPDSVRDVVAQRLARLPAEAGEMLAVAAAIGQTFDIEVLAEVVSRPAEDTLSLLEEVERIALVHETTAGRFGFSHAIVRATLLESSSASRRRLLHRRIAEAVERLSPTEHDELARHWLLAGVEEKAHAMLELAARRDLEALAYESALERFDALVAYHRRAAADPTALARAWLGLGQARRSLGLVEYREAVDEAGRLGRRLRDVDIMAAAAIASVWPGTFFLTAGAVDPALVELCEDSLERIPTDDPRRVRILSTLAAHLSFDRDRDRRTRVLAEALDLARASGDPELVGSVLAAEYLTVWDASTFDRRQQITIEVARAARASGDVELTFYAGFFAAFCAAEQCDVDGARVQLQALDAAIEATHNFYFRFLVDRLLLSLDLLCGRPGLHADIDALAARYASTHADTTGTWSVQVGVLAMQNGTLGDLVPTLTSMHETTILVPNWAAALGLGLVEQGKRDEATAVLDALGEPTLDYFWLVTMQAIAELVVELERRDLVPRLRSALQPYRNRLGITGSGAACFGLVSTSLGQLAFLDGDLDEATALLEGAIVTADEMGAPYESTKARRALAQVLALDGRSPDRLATLIDDASDLAARHGFAGEASRLIDIAETRLV